METTAPSIKRGVRQALRRFPFVSFPFFMGRRAISRTFACSADRSRATAKASAGYCAALGSFGSFGTSPHLPR